MTDRVGPVLGRPVAAGLTSRWAPLILMALAAAIIVVVPALALLDAALESGLRALLDGIISAAPAISASVWTSLAATALATTLGAGLAIATERTDVPGRRGIRLAMLVALVVPGYVAAMGWLSAYGPGGFFDDVFGLAAAALLGPVGIVLVLGVEATPLVYLIVAAGLAIRAEPDLERAARASGASALTALRTVTLPLLRPVIAGGAAIAFVVSVTSFGAPAVLGIPASFTTMTTRIYRDLAFSSDPDSFVRAIGLAIVLAIAAAIVIAVADALLERRRSERSGVFAGPVGRATGPVSRILSPGGSGAAAGGSTIGASLRPRAALAGAVAWALITLLVIVPLVALLLTAITRAPGLPPVPSSWTLDNFRDVLDARTLAALGNSLALSLAAAVAVVALAGLAVVARRGRGAGLTGGMLGLTFALPGSTLAVAILLAYGVALRDTLAIILVAYLAKFWALGYRPVAAGLDAIPRDLHRAARISGASALTATRTVIVPILRPMILVGGLIVFLFGLHEVTMSSLLYGPGSATLAVVVLNLQQLGEPNVTAALAVVLVAILVLASLPLLRWTGALDRVGWRR